MPTKKRKNSPINSFINFFDNSNSTSCSQSTEKQQSFEVNPIDLLLTFGQQNVQQSCIECTSGHCPPPPGAQPNPIWAKRGFIQNCQNCNDDPYRLVNWHDYGGGCFDPTNQCFWVTDVEIPCMSGDPPQPYFCYEEELTECVIENCYDGDGDGYYSAIIGPCFQEPFDCDDINPDINPGMTEICYDRDYDDENCDDLHNCEDEHCRTSEGGECDEQCDQDGDSFYSEACGGEDCMDNPVQNQNAANIFPGHDVENTAQLCSDGISNDCDYDIDCEDSDCDSFCQGTPTPTPPGDGGGGDGDGDGGGGDGDGDGEHCHLETIGSDDCCPWNPYTWTCNACPPVIIMVCD